MFSCLPSSDNLFQNFWRTLEEFGKNCVSRVSKPVLDGNKPVRKDLRHLKAFAIDDPKTNVVDDAFALDHENEEICWVFIADPTGNQGNEFLRTVQNRRLDKEIVLRDMSLDAPNFRGFVLAYKFENGLTDLRECTLAYISKPIRFTPAETAMMIKENSGEGADLRKLLCIAEVRKSCCRNVSSNEVKKLVQNFMVATCRGAGIIGKENGIPLLFKTQRSRGEPAHFSPYPGMHDCLGLDAYAQVTSPLRRWSDLVNHCQLVSYLLNEEQPLSRIQIEDEADVLEQARLRRSRSLI